MSSPQHQALGPVASVRCGILAAASLWHTHTSGSSAASWWQDTLAWRQAYVLPTLGCLARTFFTATRLLV